MHQVKKGKKWHFGERVHIGADAGTGYVHSLDVTAANESERAVVPKLIREDDEVVYGDAGYTGLAKRPEFQADARLSSIDYRINTRNRCHWPKTAPGFDWERYIEYQKSQVRSKVEYVFLVIKRIFGYRKVRYKCITKNKTHAFVIMGIGFSLTPIWYLRSTAGTYKRHLNEDLETAVNNDFHGALPSRKDRLFWVFG